MKVTSLSIPAVKRIEPRVMGDERGFFMESYNHDAFNSAVGEQVDFVQDNHSCSVGRVVRGLHYQLPPHAQGKLVRVVSGAVFDVAVDMRRSSPTYGQWVGEIISAENKRQLWIPVGFAHGFMVLSEKAELLYKTTDFWHAGSERSVRWDDPSLAIQWPADDPRPPLLSAKDKEASFFHEAEPFP